MTTTATATEEYSEPTMNASVSPTGAMELLSQHEVERLHEIGHGHIYELFRRCALAVLNCDNITDSAQDLYEQYPDFDIEIIRRTRGIKLKVVNAPACAFVDGVMLNGVREHLFAVLRDIVFVSSELYRPTNNSFPSIEQTDTDYDSIRIGEEREDAPGSVKNLVFHVLRNAGLLELGSRPNVVVCWGGHSISREEYDYSKAAGYHMGLRGMDICTGCGPGAMKGPMKGATIGHAKQRIRNGRYIGVSEPGIIAAESPNPIVNQLVVLPDIEKRLEAFLRLGHAIVVFPGGVGTLEEVLFLLGTLMDEANRDNLVPVVFADTDSSNGYFRRIDQFLVATLGEQVRDYYEIIEDDPEQVALSMKKGLGRVSRNRSKSRDAFYYNWLLRIPEEMKRPFEVSHEAMSEARLSRELPPAELAVNMRRVFSGIVAGNVKDKGMRLVREHGPFQLQGDPEIMKAMDRLLASFVAERRMKLSSDEYDPCYTIAP